MIEFCIQAMAQWLNAVDSVTRAGKSLFRFLNQKLQFCEGFRLSAELIKSEYSLRQKGEKKAEALVGIIDQWRHVEKL